MKTKQGSFKSLEEVKQGIIELSKLPELDGLRQGETIDDFVNRYNKIFSEKIGEIPHVVQNVEMENRPLRLYRLRKESTELNNNLISTYSHPPAYVAREIQRASLPYHPVFYSSDNPSTVIAEGTKFKDFSPTDTFYLSEWAFRPNQVLRIIAFLFDVVDSEIITKYVENNLIQLRTLLSGYPIEQQDGIIAYLRYLSTLFVYDDTYKVSAWIAHTQIYAKHGHRPDIFLYPSIQSERKSVNFAVHPNAVSQKLLLENIYSININSIEKDNNRISITINECAENKDGIFHWFPIHGNTKSEHKGFERLKKYIKHSE